MAVVVLFWIGNYNSGPYSFHVDYRLVFSGHDWSVGLDSAAVVVDLCWPLADHGHRGHCRGNDRGHRELLNHQHVRFGSGQQNHLLETKDGCCAEGGHHLLSLDDAVDTGYGDLI